MKEKEYNKLYQLILIVKPSGKKSREEYRKLLVNLLFYDIQLAHANAIKKSTMNRYWKRLRK